MDFERYKQEPDSKIMKKFDDDYANFLFVGRLSPNKKQEDIIKTFYYYHKYINSNSRLFLIGSQAGAEKYHAQLQNLVTQLNLDNIHIMGRVDFKELLAYYKLADVFISMSEHEGFCVPLLESMYFGIPIIAFDSTAIPYTLKGCGVLFKEKQYEEVAELMNFLMDNRDLNHRIVEKQRKRLKEFDKSGLVELLKGYIEKVAT